MSSKKPFLLENEKVSTWKHVRKLSNRQNRTRLYCISNYDETLCICIIQNTKPSALQHSKSVRHGQNQQKENADYELNIFVLKFLSKENEKLNFSAKTAQLVQ